jgi:tetratricopeptide (TPR) repeat protein
MASESPRPRLVRLRVLAAALIVAAGSLAYANSFTQLFAGADAKESIRDNHHIRQLWPLSEAMSLPLLDDALDSDEGGKGGTVVRRPILSLSFALNYQLSGLDPRGFHAGNLAIHLGAALLLFGIVRRTLRERVADERGVLLALVVALLWVVHPLQTEAVTYIVQRAESLMSFFLLLTLYCAVRALDAVRPGAWYGCAVVACALGMGTKETMVVTPLLVVLYDYTFAPRWRPRLYIGLAATWTVLLVLLLATAGDVAKDFEGGGTLPYLLAQPGVVLHYLRLTAWPWPLHVYISTELFDVESTRQGLFPAVVVVALLAFTVWALWRRRWYGFLGAWFFLILAPTSSIIATSDVIQEHRMYLPLAAVVSAVVLLGDAALRRLSPAASRTRLGVAIVAAAVVLLGSVTRARNVDYHGEFSMVHPADLPEAYMILAQHHLYRGDLDAAANEAQEVLVDRSADRRDVVFAHFLSGFAAERRGELEAAATHFRQAVKLQPDLAYAQRELASILMRLGRLDEAAEQCELALQTRPRFPEAHYEYGMILMQQNRSAEAVEHLERAVALQPGFAEAHYELAMALLDGGDMDGARRQLRRAIELRADLTEARELLQRIDSGHEKSGQP